MTTAATPLAIAITNPANGQITIQWTDGSQFSFGSSKSQNNGLKIAPAVGNPPPQFQEFNVVSAEMTIDGGPVPGIFTVNTWVVPTSSVISGTVNWPANASITLTTNSDQQGPYGGTTAGSSTFNIKY